MSRKTFKGGIHPPERKELSQDKAIENAYPFTKTVYIPVTQGGAPNQAIVAEGDIVVRGQKIAETDAFMSAPVHASISGVVKAIKNNLVSGNSDAQCIIIEANDSDETDFLPILDPFTCSKEAAIARVREAGIVGMGGAAFPTHVKLNPPPEKKIEFVIANAAECEPYLTIDERTLIEHADKFIDGLLIAMHIVQSDAGIIALEDNKIRVIPYLEEALEKTGKSDKIGIVVCKTKYPQGGEKNLMQSVLGREIPCGKLPADIGCVINNVATLCAISEAFREGKPLIDTAFTVSGDACTSPKNLRVPVGTLVSDLMPEVFNASETDTRKIIAGGPMMGFPMKSADWPVQKNTSGVLFLTEDEANLTLEGICISCGRCFEVCPMRLAPAFMARSLKANDTEAAKKYGLYDCGECGACAFICPAKVRLVQKFRTGKLVARKKDATAKAKAEAKEAAKKAKEEKLKAAAAKEATDAISN